MKLKSPKRGKNPLKLFKVTFLLLKITLKLLGFLLGPVSGIWESISQIHEVHVFWSVNA